MEFVGIKYKLRKSNSPNRFQTSRMMAIAALLATASPCFGGENKKQKDVLEVDRWLVDEFTRIQKKESSLSRSKREWVEYSFHKHFEKVI